MGSMARKWGWTVAIWTMSGAVSAGPDEATKWLMGDPITMMDYGIYKINIALHEDWYPIGGTSEFQWDDNRIVITSRVETGAQKEVEDSCSKWVERVRLRGGLKLDTGMPYGDSSAFALMFSHEGFEKLSAPKDLYKNIDAVLALNCWGLYSEADGKMGYLTITSPLLGTGYSVKKD